MKNYYLLPPYMEQQLHAVTWAPGKWGTQLLQAEELMENISCMWGPTSLLF